MLLQVVFEAREGVLLRQEITWRHLIDVSALSFCMHACNHKELHVMLSSALAESVAQQQLVVSIASTVHNLVQARNMAMTARLLTGSLQTL